MDALMVAKGDPWNPDPATVEQCHRMCAEVSRVLIPGGVFVQLSFEQEHFRRKFLLGEHVVTAAAKARRIEFDAGEEGVKAGVGHGVEVEVGGGKGREAVYGWDLCVRNIEREGGCFGQFLYIMRKRGGGAREEEK